MVLVISGDTNTEFTGITMWGVFSAWDQIQETGKATSYSTRAACVPLHWCGVKGNGWKPQNMQVA
jgi:hypothetical protein